MPPSNLEDPKNQKYVKNCLARKYGRVPEDLYSEALTELIASEHTFDPKKSSWKTWVSRVIDTGHRRWNWNNSLDLDRQANIVSFEDVAVSYDQSSGEPLLYHETIAGPVDVFEAVARKLEIDQAFEIANAVLTEEERYAVGLQHTYKKVKEIAKRMGCSERKVEDLLQKAKAKLYSAGKETSKP